MFTKRTELSLVIGIVNPVAVNRVKFVARYEDGRLIRVELGCPDHSVQDPIRTNGACIVTVADVPELIAALQAALEAKP